MNSNPLFQHMEAKLNRIHQKMAGWLNRKTAGFNRSTWLLLLAAFIIISSAISIYLFIRGLKQF